MKWATLRLLHLQRLSDSAVSIIPERFFNYLCKLHHSTLPHTILSTYPMQGNGENYRSISDCSSSDGVCVWSPRELLNAHHTMGNGYACIVLNRTVHVQPQMVKEIWQNAQIRCLVDGGANHWREFLQKHCLKDELKRPQYITGDFDSITDETRAFFNATDIKYEHTPDQNETDFTKAVRFLKPQLEARQLCEVIALQECTGRLDQIMANINTLHKLQSNMLNIYLLSSTCLSWLLLPGKHKIVIQKELVERKRWCALIPVGSKANAVTTTGLKWNLSQSSLEFGYMVSTSNTYAAEEVCVQTDKSLVWSMGL